MGAHMGSFEVMRSVGRRRPGLQVSMAMYEDNARKINAILAAINPAARPDIISLGQIDAMLQYRRAPRPRRLRRHAGRSNPGRRAGAGGDAAGRARLPAHRADARGGDSALPGDLHGWACIAARIAITWYSSRSRIFRRLPPERAMPPCAPRSSATPRCSIKYCRSDPYNWFNFFDFWRERADEPAA